MDSATSPAFALLVSRDLFFTSRITGTAESLGSRVEVVDNITEDSSLSTLERPACVIVDLANRNVRVADVMQRFPPTHLIPVIAFGAHVHTGRLQEARQAGCSAVYSKGQFASGLPDILRQYLGNAADDNTTPT